MGIINDALGKEQPSAQAEDESKGMLPEEEFDDNEKKDPEGFDKFMFVVESIISDKKSKTMQKIANAIMSAADLPRILATTTYDLVARVDDETGGMLSEDDLAAAAMDTLDSVAAIAESAGKPPTERHIQKAVSLMLHRFAEEAGDVEALQAFQQVDQQQAAQDAESMPPPGGPPTGPPPGGPSIGVDPGPVPAEV